MEVGRSVGPGKNTADLQYNENEGSFPHLLIAVPQHVIQKAYGKVPPDKMKNYSEIHFMHPR